MLTIRAMSNGTGYAKKYLEQSDYYSENEKVAGQWYGKGAEQLGLTGEVEHEQFERIRQGLHPETGEKLRQRTSADRTAKDGTTQSHGRNLYDMTWSAPKSLSLLAILTGDERLIEAHERAVEAALAETERHAATRVRINGQQGDRITGNLVIARYTHFENRWLSPQLHTHTVAVNISHDAEEGRWKALQASGIYQRRSFLTEVYRNILAAGVQEAGYQIENREPVKGRDMGFEIKGVPQPLIEKFSEGINQREQVIDAFKKKHGREPSETQIANEMRKARPKKKTYTTAEVRAQQQERLTADERRTLAQVREQADRNRSRVQTHSAEASLQYALDHVFERVSVAPDHVILSEALKHGRGGVNLKDLRSTLAKLEADKGILYIEGQIATRAALERERDMINLINRGVAKHERLGKGLTDFEISARLNAGQRQAIDFVLNSCDFAVNVEGAAGAGKTRMLNELRRSLQASGRLMLALAPTLSGAEELQKEGFKNAATVESLLQNKDAHMHLTGRAIILDEAAMVSGRQMHELLKLASRYDARMVFTGDIRQLQSVEASDALRILLKESHLANASVALKEVQRQQAKEYKEAIEALRESPAKGLEMLGKMGAVREVGLLDRAEAVAEAYRKAKGKTIVVCPTHEEIGRVTTAIRADLRGQGKLGAEAKLDRLNPLNFTEAQKTDARNFTPGHVLVFHRGTKDARKYESFTVIGQDGHSVEARNEQGRTIHVTRKQAKSFGVFERQGIDVAAGDWLSIQANVRDDAFKFTNGERVKVAHVNEQGGIVLDDKRTIPHNFRQFTHGYAITAHRSQGKTVDEVIISGERFNKELFYVAASRGKHRITIFTGDKEQLHQSIGVSGERMSALELLRQSARTVDRTRFAERTPTVLEMIGKVMQKIWDNVPRILFGEQYAPERGGRELGR